MGQINLLEETLAALRSEGKTPEDVLFVSGRNWLSDESGIFSVPWEAFERQAAKTCYDNGYGCAEIDECLVVAGDGWWLERAEYDGSEWWEYKSAPKPGPCGPILALSSSAAGVYDDDDKAGERAMELAAQAEQALAEALRGQIGPSAAEGSPGKGSSGAL